MKAVIGLGNPGRRYEFTRHNLGYRVVEGLGELWPGRFVVSGDCLVRVVEGEKRFCLCLPLTFMNESGRAVNHLLSLYDVSHSELLVVCDDVNLPLGKVRLRASGGDGGHKGLASIIQSLGTECFPRLRLGIGPSPDGSLTDFVLSPFGEEEIPQVETMVNKAVGCAELFLSSEIENAMNFCNQREEKL